MHTTRYVLAGLAIATGSAVVAVAGGGAVGATNTNPDPVGEQRAERLYTDAHRSEATVTQAEAERRGLAVRPGQLVESHLENEGHGLRWEVKTTDGSRTFEVQLDPSTAAVVDDHGRN